MLRLSPDRYNTEVRFHAEVSNVIRAMYSQWGSSIPLLPCKQYTICKHTVLSPLAHTVSGNLLPSCAPLTRPCLLGGEVACMHEAKMLQSEAVTPSTCYRRNRIC